MSKQIAAGTTTVGVIPSISPPHTSMIRAMCPSASGNPSAERESTVISESTPWMRSSISVANPLITAFTTIIVATPSVTLMIDAKAIYRVRR